MNRHHPLKGFCSIQVALVDLSVAVSLRVHSPLQVSYQVSYVNLFDQDVAKKWAGLWFSSSIWDWISYKNHQRVPPTHTWKTGTLPESASLSLSYLQSVEQRSQRSHLASTSQQSTRQVLSLCSGASSRALTHLMPAAALGQCKAPAVRPSYRVDAREASHSISFPRAYWWSRSQVSPVFLPGDAPAWSRGSYSLQVVEVCSCFFRIVYCLVFCAAQLMNIFFQQATTWWDYHF